MPKMINAALIGLLLSVSAVANAAVGEVAAPEPLPPGLQLLEQQALKGDVAAQSELGMAYVLGKGISRDYQQARDWLSKAAEKGDAVAQALLGYLYRDGLGVERDAAAAARWYQAAAAQGMSTRKPIWRSCIKTVKASRAITLKPWHGSIKPPSKGMFTLRPI